MFIIFGVKNKVITEDVCLNDHCPGCSSEHFYLTITQPYIHLFWIPFVPLNKRPLFYCRSCGRSFKIRKLPPVFQKTLQACKAEAKTPAYYFLGLGVTLLGFLVLLLS